MTSPTDNPYADAGLRHTERLADNLSMIGKAAAFDGCPDDVAPMREAVDFLDRRGLARLPIPQQVDELRRRLAWVTHRRRTPSSYWPGCDPYTVADPDQRADMLSAADGCDRGFIREANWDASEQLAAKARLRGLAA